MLNADFSDRTYTAEILKCKSAGDDTFKAILRLTIEQQIETQNDESTGAIVRVCHAYLPSKRQYHRIARVITIADGKQITIPRQRKGDNLYDVFIAQSRGHIVVAVPFHELAEDFFLKVDDCLGGTGARYEKLDITAMVIRLGASGTTKLLTSRSDIEIGLSVTRCHLVYIDQENRKSNLQQLCMTGANLGASKEYKTLISPVLSPQSSAVTVTPIILGFALSANGVRKSSATTDRHGNFKIWVAPGLRRLVRLFDLLETIEAIKDVTLTTSNIPILQSKTIREAED